MLKAELTGAKLKKALGLRQAAYRYHNKNKGGGNFAINLIQSNGPLADREQDYELSGEYYRDGTITGLRFGRLYDVGIPIPHPHRLTFDDLVYGMAKVINGDAPLKEPV